MWAIAAFVPGIVSLILMPLVIYCIEKPEITETPNAPAFVKERLQQLGPMSLSEKITLGTFILLLLMWAGIPAILWGSIFNINPTTTAFIGLSILLATGILSWDDVLKNKGAWDTIVWFSALVMMASFLGKLGLIDWMSQEVQNNIQSLGLNWIWATLILILIYVYSHYFFASTTAHITAMFSAFLAAGLALGAPPMLLGLILAFSSSFMMSLTHYGTGTAPVIFGSGYVKLGQWWKIGFVMSVINLIIWILLGSVWWKILNYW